MLSVIAEIFSIWFLVALFGAVSFASFATNQRKLAEQVTRRDRQ